MEQRTARWTPVNSCSCLRRMSPRRPATISLESASRSPRSPATSAPVRSNLAQLFSVLRECSWTAPRCNQHFKARLQCQLAVQAVSC